MILPKSFFDSASYFGISIGASSVKAVSVDGQGKVLSYAKTPLSNLDLSQPKPNLSPLIDALKSIKADGNFSSPYVAIVLPENQAFSKRFVLPAVSLAEFSQAIAWQMGDIFPFSPDEVYSDWKILLQSSKTIEALVVAVNRAKIDHLRTCLAAVGLYPVSFETSVSALSKISEFSHQTLSILIDINTQDSSVSIIESGVPLLTTTNVLPGDASNLVESLALSISTLGNYYQDKRQSPLDSLAITLTGDRADDNLAKTLQSKINRPVSLLNISQINPGFHQAYAAAISHVEPPEDEHSINLLPEDLRAWYHSHYRQTLLKKTQKIQLTAFLIGLILTAANLGFLSSKLNGLDNNPVLSDGQKVVDTYNPGELVKKANRINTLFSGKTGPQETLQAALLLVPPNIKVENVTYEDAKKTFEITGQSPTRNELMLLKDYLEKSTLFDKVTLPLGSLTQQTNSSFSIKFSREN